MTVTAAPPRTATTAPLRVAVRFVDVPEAKHTLPLFAPDR